MVEAFETCHFRITLITEKKVMCGTTVDGHIKGKGSIICSDQPHGIHGMSDGLKVVP